MERCVLITGCSSGIGRATASAFLDEEWDVMATARNREALGALKDDGCRIASLDVTDEESIHRVVDQTLDEIGRIDCLVNNAGYSQVGAFEDMSTSRVERQFAVNVFGPHRLTRAVLPHMRRREDGTIVNISSILGRLALPGTSAYAGSKFALEAFSDALRAEVSPLGIDVVVIEPGPVPTQLKDRAGRELAALARTDDYEGLYRLIDDWRVLDGGPGSATVDDVADVVVNAASSTQPEPRYVVGGLGVLGSLARYVPAQYRDSLYRLALRATSIRSRS